MLTQLIRGMILRASVVLSATIMGCATVQDAPEAYCVPQSAEQMATPGRYVGAIRMNVGDYSSKPPFTLSPGPGNIIGTATMNGAPVAGLRVRLKLNGNGDSPWATTDQLGKYSINLPYGEYRIDGFELDRNSANSVLTNKTNLPMLKINSEPFSVSEHHSGSGPALQFNDPVIKKDTGAIFSLSAPIILAWDAFPKANGYRIEIQEKQSARRLEWQSIYLGSVDEPKFDAKKHGITFQPGRYYQFEVIAFIDAKEAISQSFAQGCYGIDFQVKE